MKGNFMNTKKILVTLNVFFCFISSLIGSDIFFEKIKLEEYYINKYSNLIETIIKNDQFKININLDLITKQEEIVQSNLDEYSSKVSEIELNKENKKITTEENSKGSIFDMLSGIDEYPTDQDLKNNLDTDIGINDRPSTQTFSKKDVIMIENFEATIYLDDTLPIARTQVEIKNLLCSELPDSDSCSDCDCIEFNNFELSNNTVDNSIDGLQDQLDLYKQSIDDILEAKSVLIDKQKSELDSILYEKEKMLAKLDKEYDKFKEISYQNKIDDLNRDIEENDLQKHIQAQEIKSQYKKIEKFYSDQIDAIKEENSAWFAIIMDKFIHNNTPSSTIQEIPVNYSQSNSNMIFALIIFILMGGFVSMFIIMKQQPQPVYLKPKNNASSNKKRTINTNNKTDKINSEVKSLRQSAVAMSVGNKNTATKVVREWLNDKK
tara:strand:- start:813 stop:2117 length:1305 start_codon:yes stop_codon:yes gene_type:complete